MQASYARLKEMRVRDIGSFNAMVPADQRLPWHVVVLDEYADLTSEKDAKKAIEGLVQRIAQKARACGIHLIVATQKPSADVISTTTRSNLGAQLALRVKSSVDSRVIMDEVGAESLAGNGDAFLRLSGLEPQRVQCALYKDDA
jgi:DNA segregation ATPase FtsK/SpoIIIE-like protein